MQKNHDFFPRKTVRKAADFLQLRSASTSPTFIYKGTAIPSFSRILKSTLYVTHKTA